jgi:chemosensory pili system protein ChpC
MRAQAIEKKIEEVASLLIPLGHCQLLAPNVSIAEIVPIPSINPIEDSPHWLMGICSWRKLDIPVVSFELMNDEKKPNIDNRSRIAVFNTTGVSDSLHFFAILTQGLPRLARVSEEEISQREDADLKPYELMHVFWAGEEAVIPDVEAMERVLVESVASMSIN